MAQTVVPMMAYEDAATAIDWLMRAFGFEEVADQRYIEEDGRVGHAELRVGEGASIFVATPTPDYVSPKRHREECEVAARWSSVRWVVDGLMVYVDDVTAHAERAEAAGAEMLSPVREGPDGLRYRAEDLEGHRWMFVGR